MSTFPVVSSLPEQFWAVLEAAPDAMVVTDRSGRLVLVNHLAEELFGYLMSELIGEPVERLIPERFHALHSEHRERHFTEVGTGPRGTVFEAFGLRSNGSEFPAEISLRPLHTAYGGLAISAIRDVTSQKKEASKFRALLEAAPVGMLIADGEGRIVLVNAQIEKLFGYRRDELLGREVEMLIPERFRSVHPVHRSNYFGEPICRPMGGIGVPLNGLRSDGTEFPVEINLSPLDTEDGLLAITAIRDVSERRRAEEEKGRLYSALQAMVEELEGSNEKAKALEELKTRFFANISHELRTPLALVLGPVDRLLGCDDLRSDQRHDLDIIRRNAGTLLKHVNDLLDVAKLEAGKMGIEYSDVNVAALLRLVTGYFDGMANERRIVLSVEAPGTLWAQVDEDKLHRILLNLLSNAFKFTPTLGKIRCSLSMTDDAQFRIEIGDSGPGVGPENRQAIFERFRQVHIEDAGHHIGGTGLGLTIVRDFVVLHGGKVFVDSAPEGGALFVIQLPLTAPSGITVQPAGVSSATPDATVGVLQELFVREESDSPTIGRGESLVLVIEDNAEMNCFLRQSLAKHHRVEAASDGREGLNKALEKKPDLIITDMMMPGLNGEQLIQEIRKHPELQNIPIILLTARADDDLKLRLLRDGAQDYLTKPFSLEELRVRVGNLIAMKRARDVLQSELETQSVDLESLARQVTRRTREAKTALASIEVAREQAERASKTKSEFLGMVSHELRTPITGLQLHMQQLMRNHQVSLTEKQKKLIRRMSASTGRLVGLVESLLHYTNMQSGRIAADLATCDAGEIASSALEEVRPQAEEKGLVLHLSIPYDLPPLQTDPLLLRLIVVNLLVNAVKFTERGFVEVELEHLAGAHQIKVKDTGAGIAPENRVRVFEPFEQVEPVRNKHLPGIGLGLALVKEMTVSLGGRVLLESELGAGSTFTVILPSAVEHSAVATAG